LKYEEIYPETNENFGCSLDVSKKKVWSYDDVVHCPDPTTNMSTMGRRRSSHI
jgi:hypothetical protein